MGGFRLNREHNFEDEFGRIKVEKLETVQRQRDDLKKELEWKAARLISVESAAKDLEAYRVRLELVRDTLGIRQDMGLLSSTFLEHVRYRTLPFPHRNLLQRIWKSNKQEPLSLGIVSDLAHVIQKLGSLPDRPPPMTQADREKIVDRLGEKILEHLGLPGFDQEIDPEDPLIQNMQAKIDEALDDFSKLGPTASEIMAYPVAIRANDAVEGVRVVIAEEDPKLQELRENLDKAKEQAIRKSQDLFPPTVRSPEMTLEEFGDQVAVHIKGGVEAGVYAGPEAYEQAREEFAKKFSAFQLKPLDETNRRPGDHEDKSNYDEYENEDHLDRPRLADTDEGVTDLDGLADLAIKASERAAEDITTLTGEKEDLETELVQMRQILQVRDVQLHHHRASIQSLEKRREEAHTAALQVVTLELVKQSRITGELATQVLEKGGNLQSTGLVQQMTEQLTERVKEREINLEATRLRRG